VDIEVPQDRHGSFEPQLVKKRQTRFTGFDEKILGMYARGMTVRDIQSHLEDIYGVEVSPDLISRATSVVADDVVAWQNRPLDAVCPIVYLDAFMVKARSRWVSPWPEAKRSWACGSSKEKARGATPLQIRLTEEEKTMFSEAAERDHLGLAAAGSASRHPESA
jgi:hypothetical protein